MAEDAIAAALKAKDTEIKAWLASGSKKPYIADAMMDITIGIKVPKGTTVAVPVSSVRAVLIRDKKAPLGYYILTGHPK